MLGKVTCEVIVTGVLGVFVLAGGFWREEASLWS